MKVIFSQSYTEKLENIPGSVFFRYYCDGCGEAMRAKESEIDLAQRTGYPVYCLKCNPTGVPGKSLTKNLNTIEEDPDAFRKSFSGCLELVKVGSFGTGHWQTKGFRECLRKLPPQIQKLANEKYQILLSNPQQVGIKPMVENGFKIPIWSAQVGGGHRALALKYQSYYVWYWIGTHEEYNRVKGMPASKEAVNVINGIARKSAPSK